MSLQLALLRTGISTTGEEMYISDSTGDYLETDNDGGWGTPNSDRSEKALLVSAVSHKTDDTDDVAITIDDYDPETVDSFVLHPETDGYIEMFMVAVDKEIPTEEGTFGWDTTYGLQKYSDGVLTTVTAQEVYEDVDFTGGGVSYKTILLANIAIYRNEKNLELIKLRMRALNSRSGEREVEDLEDHFLFIRGLLEGARYLWCMDSYMEAQRVIEAFEEVAYDE